MGKRAYINNLKYTYLVKELAEVCRISFSRGQLSPVVRWMTFLHECKPPCSLVIVRECSAGENSPRKPTARFHSLSCAWAARGYVIWGHLGTSKEWFSVGNET